MESRAENLNAVISIDEKPRNKFNISQKFNEQEEEEWLATVPDDLKSFCKKMDEGCFQPLDFDAGVKPDWLDPEKIKKGQQFAKKYYFSLNLMSMIMLFPLFADKFVKKSFLFFDNNNTPFKMLRRQLRTTVDLQSCYETEIWRTAPDSSKNKMERVLKTHKYFLGRLDSHTTEDIDKKVSIYDGEDVCLKLPSHKKIQDDFKNSCDDSLLHRKIANRTSNVFFSQTSFMWIQFSFLGLAINNPKYFGIYGAKDEDWDAFLHLWRAIGYLLGIRDDYNFCNADLTTVKNRSKLLTDLYLKQSFKEIGASWEYAVRCGIDGVKLFAPIPIMSFESAFLYLCKSVDFPIQEFKTSVSYWQFLSYLLIRFLAFLQIIPGVSQICGWVVYTLIMRASKASPETLQKWKEVKFSYVIDETSG